MQSVIDKYSIKKARTDLPEIKIGHTIKVHQKVKEGNKERIQIFEGLVIAMHRKQGTSATITVRKDSFGIGVERVFPLSAPFIEKIEIVKQAKVRRAKLFYMRGLKGKAARMKNIPIKNQDPKLKEQEMSKDENEEANIESQEEAKDNIQETAKTEQNSAENQATEELKKEEK